MSIVGSVKVSTLYYGAKNIFWLSQNIKEPFLVYCFDFEKKDYTLNWASEPRYVKTIPTIRILLNDSTEFTCTTDQKILNKKNEWVEAKKLKYGDELMPFYRVPPNKMLNPLKVKQFPRIFTFKDGWKHERQFIDEWNTGKTKPFLEKVNRICRAIASDLKLTRALKLTKHNYQNSEKWLAKEGFTFEEIQWLGAKNDNKRVIGMLEGNLQDVYDLTVKEHENFCIESVVVGNC